MLFLLINSGEPNFLPRLVEGRLNVHDLLFASKADIVIGDVYFTLFALRSL